MNKQKQQLTLKQAVIITSIQNDLKKKFLHESTGHDWWHIERVYNMARYIAKCENKAVNMFIVEAAALLHDIADWKFHKGDDTIGPKQARDILKNYGVKEDVVNKVSSIIKDISFKGADVITPVMSLEGKIVQDADRLDAIGAIGIARTFAYGGYKNIPIHDPKSKPKRHKSFKSYQKKGASTINHFYEKLLLLKNRMNTKTGKKLAIKRHQFMEKYLKQFYRECQEAQ